MYLTFQDEPKCHNQTKSVVIDVPQESCDIIPGKICRNANKLVPHLTPVEKCENSPREVCSFGLKSPETKNTPLITKWCYNASDPANVQDSPTGSLFGEKLIKKVMEKRNPKRFRQKNTFSASRKTLNRDPLEVPNLPKINDVPRPRDEIINEKLRKPSIFGSKLIPRYGCSGSLNNEVHKKTSTTG